MPKPRQPLLHDFGPPPGTKRKKAGKPYEKIGSGCTEDCMNCSEKGCTKRFYDADATEKKPEAQIEKTDEEKGSEGLDVMDLEEEGK